ncbi:MAG: saccharopine dehydrogenase NADP-binding domain-containing protein [Pseudomonadota bacterium]
MSAANDREFDVIIWGASGFTGRLVAEYLCERYDAPSQLNWAMAGRSEEKLKEVREALGPSAKDIPILTGDSHNPDSLAALVARTKVICTTVGPYAKYGSELVAACVSNGTHYCDLAGEVQWMRAMIDKHQEEALASGARIVHTCGFDSIPSDIGVYYLQQQAKERHGQYFSEIKYRVKAAKGGPSGGTIASMLVAMDEARADRDVAKILVHPYSLNPEGERTGPDRRDQQGMVFDEDLQAWTAPFVMATVNTKVVRRSNALMNYPYGRDFRYSESTLMGKGAAGWMKATGLTAGLGGFMLAANVGPLRKLMNKTMLPQPGEGPNREERENGFYNIKMVGKFNDGRVLFGKVTGDRDPGYGSTSKMLAESAICLAKDPVNGATGFLTPSSAMGDHLLKRLVDNAGLTFELSD